MEMPPTYTGTKVNDFQTLSTRSIKYAEISLTTLITLSLGYAAFNEVKSPVKPRKFATGS